MLAFISNIEHKKEEKQNENKKIVQSQNKWKEDEKEGTKSQHKNEQKNNFACVN